MLLTKYLIYSTGPDRNIATPKMRINLIKSYKKSKNAQSGQRARRGGNATNHQSEDSIMQNDITRAVKAKRYGNEGLMPADKHSCPYRGASACVSASGGNYCGGYGGDAPIRGTQLHSVRCLEENNADFALCRWLKMPQPLRPRQATAS